MGCTGSWNENVGNLEIVEIRENAGDLESEVGSFCLPKFVVPKKMMISALAFSRFAFESKPILFEYFL